MKSSANDDWTFLGKRLKYAREYRGLSQQAAARAVGLPQTSIWRVEYGRRKISVLELKKLAALYQRPVSYFIGEEEVFDDSLPLRVKHLVRATAMLSPKDLDDLARFAEFLRSRREEPV
jgi:transcriptional regulator with XRE-family HTH domain